MVNDPSLVVRDRFAMTMDEHDEWNRSNYVERRREERMRAINNTDGYRTGYRIHQLRTIQVTDAATWNQLFGRELLNPTLREYAQSLFHHRPTVAQMEVSLLMVENYRPRVHVAIFIVYLIPHRQFYDGHIIQMEFSEDSYTHQTVNRMFHVANENTCVLLATEYSILNFAADDSDMLDLLHLCFIDRDFQTMRFGLRDGREHPWHAQMMFREENYGDMPALVDDDEPVVQIPPPPTTNYVEAFYRQYNLDNNDDDDDDDDDVLPA